MTTKYFSRTVSEVVILCKITFTLLTHDTKTYKLHKFLIYDIVVPKFYATSLLLIMPPTCILPVMPRTSPNFPQEQLFYREFWDISL